MFIKYHQTFITSKSKNVYIIACLVTCLSGCIVIPRNYKYAKHPFSLTEYLKSAETKLDTSSYYFNEWGAFRKEGNVNIVDVMKFHSDGRFEFRAFEGKAFTKELGDTLASPFDYYKIEKGILKLEVYMTSMEGFSYWKGNVYPDSIVFFQFPGAGNLIFKKSHLVYKKMK